MRGIDEVAEPSVTSQRAAHTETFLRSLLTEHRLILLLGNVGEKDFAQYGTFQAKQSFYTIKPEPEHLKLFSFVIFVVSPCQRKYFTLQLLVHYDKKKP